MNRVTDTMHQQAGSSTTFIVFDFTKVLINSFNDLIEELKKNE